MKKRRNQGEEEMKRRVVEDKKTYRQRGMYNQRRKYNQLGFRRHFYHVKPKFSTFFASLTSQNLLKETRKNFC
jgi:hypothetical protein